MKLITVVLFFLAIQLFNGCSSTKVDNGFYEPNHPKYSIGLDDQGRKQGQETWWHPDGKKKYEAFNKAGARDGKFTAWYPDGNKWYEGFEYHGKPESTLTYWHANGKVKSEALFRDGIQLERRDFDEEGHLVETRGAVERAGIPTLDNDEEAGNEKARLHKAGLQIWAMRVRQTVESFWVLPSQFEKERPYRAVAKIKVGRDGKILGVHWMEKSPSPVFNSFAQATLKRIKRLPSFPPSLKEEVLEVQYEFISLGKQAPRRKLEIRDSMGVAPAHP